MSISQTAIKKELEHVLTSRCFRSRRVLCQLLMYLVEQTISGKSTELNQYTIAVHGLNKSKDFNPMVDPIVRIQAGRLRKQLEDYYATEGRFNALQFILPSGSYVPELVEIKPTPNNLTTLKSEPIQSLSLGPNILCIPRNFTQDEESNWLFICVLTRDYVAVLSRFMYCQVLFTEEAQYHKSHLSPAYWQHYHTDFVLFFDLYYFNDVYDLKCTLMQCVSQQVVWAHGFSLGEQYPSAQLCQTIFKRIAHDTVSAEKGIAQSLWVRHLMDSGNPILPHHQVLVAFRRYAWDISYDNFVACVESCEQRLQKYPYDVTALIILAEQCRGEYLLRFNALNNYQELLEDITERLSRLAPENPYTHLYYAMSCLLEERYIDTENAIERALAINNLDTHVNNLIGLVYFGLDQWEKGSLLIQDSISVSSMYPEWYHIALCIHYYREKNFLAAIQEAQRIRLKHIWTPMLRAALYQFGNYQDKKDREYRILEKDYPNFKSESTQLVQGLSTKAGGVVQQLWHSTFGKNTDD